MLDALGWASDDRMVLLEDVGRPPKSVALLLFLGLRLIPPALWERWFPGGRTAVDAAATMMFTSGSTGVPKGVVLTHANLQANIHGFRTAFPLRPTDVMVGVLPLFHSFGYTATVWFPLLNGVCVAYHRNPLEAEAVQRLVEKERGTLILSTPTVLGVWMRTWDPAAIRSLRLVIVGAEKLREATARRAHEEFHLTVLEGYGCTEMSPVVAVNTETASRPGTVGRLLEGVRARVVSPEDGRPLPDGTAGLLLVKGPNRMAGYWNDPERTSRAMRDGWYVTGDVAVVDEEGFLSITDRLARFSKIGGEMVPHLFIEEALAAQGGPDARFFVVSVADARKGEVLVVLFNGWRGTPVEVVARLAASGVPRLWIPDARNFFEAEVWPVSGAGKADLAAARAMAERKMAERGAA
jgi:acyl-[acyl-carrier-protein]-phospholipid O-acyltransferase/long-chain-fatty-acid--[acyl-carrier-protein] ligase